MSRIQSIGIAALLSSLVISPTLAQKNTVRQGAQQLRQQLNATPGLSRGDAAKVMGAYYQGMGVTPPARFNPPPTYNSPPVYSAPRQAYPLQSPSYRQPSAPSIPQYNLGNTSYPRQPAYGSHGVPPAGYVSGPGRTPAAGYGPGPANRLPTFSPGFTSATGTMPPSAPPTTQTFRYVDTAGQIRTIKAGSANEALRTAPGIARTSGVELVSPSPSQVNPATAHRTPTFSPSFNSPGGFVSATPPLQAGRPTFTPQPIRTAADDKPNPSAAARPTYIQSGTGALLTPEQVKSGTFTPGTFFVESGTGRQVPAHQVKSALSAQPQSVVPGRNTALGAVPPPTAGRPLFSPNAGHAKLTSETFAGTHANSTPATCNGVCPNLSLDQVQTGLATAGLTPGVGVVPDVVNSGISTVRAVNSVVRGDRDGAKNHALNAGLSGVSAIPSPAVGIPAAVARLARSVDPITEAANRIGKGHAFQKHVLNQGQFPGIRTTQQLSNTVESIMRNPTAKRELSNGRTAYWDEATKAVVIHHPGSKDGGTIFKPELGRHYFDIMLK